MSVAIAREFGELLLQISLLALRKWRYAFEISWDFLCTISRVHDLGVELMNVVREFMNMEGWSRHGKAVYRVGF